MDAAQGKMPASVLMFQLFHEIESRYILTMPDSSIIPDDFYLLQTEGLETPVILH